MKVLAVDDSFSMLRTLQATLAHGGYEVVTASGGEEALKAFTDDLGLVITDIKMPGMDGITFIQELRKRNADVPIIALTTEFEDEMKNKGLNAGANGWIVKPFRPQQFLDVIQQLLE